MKLIVRLLTVLLLLAGGVVLFRISVDNRELRSEIRQLEAELGRMTVDDPDRVYFVEIETPDVPSEVASHLERVWQFRCYMPPGYDVIRFSGGGRVTREGVYLSGGSNSSWGSPRPEGTHQLLTVSFQKKDKRIEAFNAFGGSSGTTSWGLLDPDHIDDSLVVQKIVSSKQGPRSFASDVILPLLRLYDPSSAENKEVEGRTITTYAGGLFVLCPKARESEFDQLKYGRVPTGFDPTSIATEASDE
jgi:hypothetical protein